MKKKIFFAILIMIMLFALVGCTGAQETEAPPETQPETEQAVEQETEPEVEEQPEETTLTVWFLSGSPEEIGLMQEMSDQFAAEHPGVTVDFSSYGFDDMNNTLRLALDGGTGPDVAYASPGPSHGAQYAAAGHLVNLASSAEEYGWIDEFPSDVLSYYNEGLEELYMAPFDMVTVGVYYNEDIYNELGLAPPESFEEFEGQLATIKEAGYIPIAVGGLDGWPLAHVWDQLLHVTAPYEMIEAVESGDPAGSYAAEEFVQAAEILDRWLDAGYFQDNMIATSYPDGNNLFINGEAAINIGGTWNNGTFSTQPEFTVRFFPMPQVNTDIPWRMGGYSPNNAWMVPVYSENQDLALAYVDYMMGPEVAEAKWNAGDIVGYKFETVPDPVSPLQADVYEAMQTTGTGQYMGNYNSEVQEMIWTAMQTMANGDIDPQEAMQMVDDVYQTVTSESGEAEPVAEEEQEEEAVDFGEATLTVWFLSQSPEEIGVMQEMSDQFSAAHPGVTIDFSSYSFEDMNNTLRLALDGGTGPDVAYSSPGPSHGGQYAAAGHLLNLTPSAEEYGWIDEFPSDVLGYYNDSLDEIYMAPFDMVTVGVFYNEDIYNELGLSAPSTFDEFESQLATIKDAGYIPISVGGLDGWPLAHIWDQLLHVTAPYEMIEAVESGDQAASYTAPEFVQATEILDRWLKAGYFQDNMIATSYADGNNLFLTGEAAINIGGTWNNGTFSTQPDFTVRFFAMPQVNPDIQWRMSGYSHNNAWMVPVYSENQDLALAYVDYMMGPEVAEAKWNAGDIVGYKFETVPDPVTPLQADVYMAMQATGTGKYMGNFNTEVQTMIWTAMQTMANGDIGPQEAMEMVDQTYQSIASEY